MTTPLRMAGAAMIATVLAVGCSGCGLFGGGGSDRGEDLSVFSVKPGQCFVAPQQVQAQLSTLEKVPCKTSHTQEAYAVVPFQEPEGQKSSGFPGNEALTTFAKGACAAKFADYVGVDYRDSSLFFTYLLPSARSWEQDADDDVICFVTTTGQKLKSSVKGSKK